MDASTELQILNGYLPCLQGTTLQSHKPSLYGISMNPTSGIIMVLVTEVRRRIFLSVLEVIIEEADHQEIEEMEINLQ